MINYNLLWTADEYEAVVYYKFTGFSKINVLLSSELTERELQCNDSITHTLQTKEELCQTIEKIGWLYTAIRKHHILNGRQECSKTLFRGTKDGKLDISFLSTSDSATTAFTFAKVIERRNIGTGLMLAIDSGNVPWISISDVIPNGDGMKDEPEILFVPSQIEDVGLISLKELFEIAEEQGENISAKYDFLKDFASLKCRKVVLRELDYLGEKTKFTIDDLCNIFEQYRKDIEVIRSAEEDSAEYTEAHARVVQFKKNCRAFINQKFCEINQNIDNQISMENSEIQLSSQYDMQEVDIGNTGEMYQISDRQNGKEYYFKPAVSKSGEDRPYRAYIQESAYHIQQIINPDNAIKCNTININGRFGAIQEKAPVDTRATRAFIDYFDNNIGELPPEIISQVIDEYLVDFCLCNYDAHANNFIIDENGKLRGIDKEQSFRYVREDSTKDMMFTVNYNAKYGEKPTIYNILFEQMKQGKISYNYLRALRHKASRLSQIPDEQYKKIFEEYVYGKAKTYEEFKTLSNSILDRKRNILQNIEQLYIGIYSKWSQNKNSQKEVSVLDSAVQATEASTTIGAINEQAKAIISIEQSKTQQPEIQTNIETQ